jgi:hypothetical protein
MNFKNVKYQFTAEPWECGEKGSWVFVALPEKMSKEIRKLFQSEEEGWGRLKATAKIGNSEWKTAIWYDKKKNTYLLPVKTAIRKKEHVSVGEPVNAEVYI